ncbi:hypothetical protein VTN02DRAFT_3010 [Thermoascus thermophilus]
MIIFHVVPRGHRRNLAAAPNPSLPPTTENNNEKGTEYADDSHDADSESSESESESESDSDSESESERGRSPSTLSSTSTARTTASPSLSPSPSPSATTAVAAARFEAAAAATAVAAGAVVAAFPPVRAHALPDGMFSSTPAGCGRDGAVQDADGAGRDREERRKIDGFMVMCRWQYQRGVV